MRNIILYDEKELLIENDTIFFDSKVLNNKIIISGKVLIYDFSNCSGSLTINMKKNSELTYYKININNEVNILINDNDSTTINYYCSSIINKEIHSNIIYNQKYNNSVVNINVKLLAIDIGKIDFLASGLVDYNTSNNIYTENIKVLTSNELEHIIKPDLIINSLDVLAVHNNTISNINKDVLFYLRSKGINNFEAKYISYLSFLVGNINDEFVIDKIKKLLEGEV